MTTRPAGFSLIEVLVSMFIVSLGILALAGLAQAAFRYGKMSELRSTATLLANDLADRVRANAAGAAGYELAGAAYPSPPPAPHAPCSRAAPCEPTGLAQADLASWNARLGLMLPGGSAYVHFRPAAGAARAGVDLWVAWLDPGVPGAGRPGDRPASECPSAWRDAGPSIRCVFLQVGL